MRHSFLLLFCAAFIASACSSDHINTDTPTPAGEKEGINFTMSEVDYEESTVQSTRAGSGFAQSELIDLGNDFEACIMQKPLEATAQSKPATRAITGPKHYSIRAYQGGVLKGSMKGTFSGTTFTPDAGTNDRMILEPGNYDFICYNDKFHEAGNDIELSQDDAKDAYFCQKTVTIYNQHTQLVPFEMKHACTRMKVDLELYGKLGTGVVANVAPTGANVPTKVTYVGATNTFTPTNGVAVGGTQTYSTPAEPDSYGNPGRAQSDEFIYFLPGTDCAHLQMRFTSGTMFGKNLTGAGTIRFYEMDETFQANRSYHLTVLMWPKWIYLFSDGTTGSLAENPPKERIGLVIQDKTATSRGLAMALKSVAGSTLWGGRAGFGGGRTFNPTNGFNTTSYPTIGSAMTDMEGEHWTYDASGTLGGTISKANDQTNFPAAYAAAHYNPGYTITGANVGRWFVPSLGQFVAALNMMANKTGYPINWSALTDWVFASTAEFQYICNTGLAMNYPLRGTDRKAIGETLRNIYGSFVTSTDVQDYGRFAIVRVRNSLGVDKSSSFDDGGEVRPFIHF